MPAQSKEYPIIFSSEAIRAILSNSKTQSRRVIKPQPLACEGHTPNWKGQILDWIGYKYSNREHWFCHTCGIGLRAIDEFSSHGIICPYGQVGDRLWVRETHIYYTDPFAVECFVGFRDGTGKSVDNFPEGSTVVNIGSDPRHWKWRPSIFMPRWASRIALEITEIRVERLQEIKARDCEFEGIDGVNVSDRYIKNDFRRLWDSLNAERGYGWEVNPWVWVLGFKLL